MTTNINEKVLQSCHEIYTKPETGLVTIAEHWFMMVFF